MTNTATPATTKKTFKAVDPRCKKCHFNSFERLLHKFQATESQKKAFYESFHREMKICENQSMAQVYGKLNRSFSQITGISNPYEKEKIESNALSLNMYKKYRIKALESENPFDMALRLAIAGNIIDYGANPDFDIPETIQKVLKSSFAIDHSKELIQRIKTAKKIMYLGDNAGEIVFDKLFIEMIMHPHMVFAVRGSNVLNDATLVDAQQVGMHLVADIISNGYDAPSTVLEECSEDFMHQYNSADLIISKGQGNFEGFMEVNDPRIFHLLMAKCDVIAETLRVEKGSFVVYNQTIEAKA